MRSSPTVAARLAAVAAALLATSPAPAAALQPLEVFIRSGRDYNPDLLEVRANHAQRRAQAQAELGRALPGVSFLGTYTRTQYEARVTIAGPGGASQEVTITPFDRWDAVATLDVPLIDLANFRRIAAERKNAQGAQRDVEARRLVVDGQVAQDYYQLVANMALVAASQKAVDVSRESLRFAEQRYDAGVGPVLDVDRARADVEQNVQQLASADLGVRIAARSLESRSGVAPDVSATVSLADDLRPEPDLSTFEAAVPELPSVLSARLGTRAAEQQAEAQRFSLVPSLSSRFSEIGTTAGGFGGNDWFYQAVLSLTWSFDLTTVADIRARDAEADAARARELRARLAARDAIHAQWSAVEAGIARSRSARAGREAAAHAAEMAQERHRAGTATQLDLLQAQRDAFAAEVAQIQADADLVNARTQLRLAAGRSPFAFDQGEAEGGR